MFIAEREGFEPPEPLSSTVFKTAAIDHSAISPVVKGTTKFGITKYLKIIFRKKVRKFLYSKNKSYI